MSLRRSLAPILLVVTVATLWLIAGYRWELRWLRWVDGVFAIAPFIAVYAAYRARIGTPRWFAHTAWLLYVAALCLPTIRLASDQLAGWNALLSNFYFLFHFVYGVFHESPGQEAVCYFVACVLGAVANVCFYISMAVVLFRPRGNTKEPRITWTEYAHVCSVAAASSALLALVPLTLSGELNGVYLGHGCWLAAHVSVMLTLYSLKTREPEPSERALGWHVGGQAMWLGIAVAVALTVVAGVIRQRVQASRMEEQEICKVR